MRLNLFIREPKNWDADIPKILYNIRTRRHAAISKIPSEMLFGLQLKRLGKWKFPYSSSDEPKKLTSDIHQEARVNQNRYLDRKHPATTEQFPRLKQGDLVTVRNHSLSNKMLEVNASVSPCWRGRYLVLNCLEGEIYEIDIDDKPVKIDGSQILRFYTRKKLKPVKSPANNH